MKQIIVTTWASSPTIENVTAKCAQLLEQNPECDSIVFRFNGFMFQMTRDTNPEELINLYYETSRKSLSKEVIRGQRLHQLIIALKNVHEICENNVYSIKSLQDGIHNSNHALEYLQLLNLQNTEVRLLRITV